MSHSIIKGGRVTDHHISSVKVERLFGRYSYSIPRDNGKLDDLNIIYGENGLGKTTLLTLVFQLLNVHQLNSAAATIARTVFEELTVTLRDGTSISATKDSQLLVGSVRFKITGGPESHSIVWTYVPGPQGLINASDVPKNIDLARVSPEIKNQVQQAYQQREFTTILSQLQVSTSMLTSDRMMLGDSTNSDRDERIGAEKIRLKISDLVTAYRNDAVVDALKSASRWLQERILDSSYQVSRASNVYESVISKIASSTYKTRSGLSAVKLNTIKQELTKDIELINNKSQDYLELGLGQTGVADSLKTTVEACDGNRLVLVDEVLRPYLSELKERQTRIEPTYKLIKQFLEAGNRFFRDKKIDFDIRRGLRIFVVEKGVRTDAEITAEQLSSGEKQLLLILCRVLTAANRPSIFIIDEPEISLNILWQRMLVSTLIELASGSAMQFILASHSMEIISQHNEKVVLLEETV